MYNCIIIILARTEAWWGSPYLSFFHLCDQSKYRVLHEECPQTLRLSNTAVAKHLHLIVLRREEEGREGEGREEEEGREGEGREVER